jgi:hypothetical protein
LVAEQLVLEESVLDTLDEIFPGYPPSPEGYAW